MSKVREWLEEISLAPKRDPLAISASPGHAVSEIGYFASCYFN
jgi:hypothetical protein